MHPSHQRAVLVRAALSLLLALCSALGWWLDAEWVQEGPRKAIAAGSFVVLAGFSYAVLTLAARVLDSWGQQSVREEEGIRSRVGLQTVRRLFALVMVVWLAVLFVCLPGSYCADWIGQVEQFYSWTFTNHHPVLGSIVYGAIYAIGNSVAGTAGGVFLTVALQLTGGLALVWLVLCWAVRLGVSLVPLTVLAVFFAACPVYAIALQWVTKDVLSFLLTGLLCLQVHMALVYATRTMDDDAPSLAHPAVIALVAILCALSRPNCIYVILPGLLVLALQCRGEHRRNCVVAICVVMACYAGWNSLLPTLGIRSGSIVEALSVPLQQTATYLQRYPDDVTAEETALLEDIAGMPTEQLAARYDVAISDPVKDVIHFDNRNELLDYLRAWWSMGKRHPLLYVRTFLAGSRGYWAPTLNPHRAYTIFDRPYSALDIPGSSTHITAYEPLFPEAKESFISLLWNVAGIPIIGCLFVPATYILATMLLGIYALSLRRPVAPLLTMAIVMLLVCCASPLYASMRYAFPFLWYLPMIFIACVTPNRS